MQQERDDNAVSALMAKQGGEPAVPAERQWDWVEPAVWTERMLQALEKGVKGGVWFSLMDKVFTLRNLYAAFERVRRNDGAAGVDHVRVRGFQRRLEHNLQRLHDELRSGRYRPQAIRRVYIDKPGSTEKRPLGIPTVRDRVVQTALRNVIEPIFERNFAQHSYGFRPGRGCKDALRRVDALLKGGFRWVVDLDVKSYFDTIPHNQLMALVRLKVADGKVLSLIESFLKAEVLEHTQWEPEAGTPQGGTVSPLLANIYLDPLDHIMAQAGFEMVRYADDAVILCKDQQEAEEALKRVQEWIEQAKLTLHPEKTCIVDVQSSNGFDFLGYHFQVSKRDPRKVLRWPRKKSLKKFKDAVRKVTKRCNGHCLQSIINKVNKSSRGFFQYFQHSNRTTFRPIDGWIRMRFRSILRKRSKRKGRGRGKDHVRWPNAFFREQGFFSMAEAHARILQSAQR